MNKSNAANGTKSDSVKRPYATPRLTVYGSVRELTGSSSGTVGDGLGMNMQPSDRALKENLVRVGEHPAGFGLYLFDYKAEFKDSCGHGRQFGVMADEVEGVIPEAVSIADNGYRAVDYTRLGITRH